MRRTDGADDRGGPSRRWFLAGGAAAVVGGGAGVGAGFLQSSSTARPTRAPAALTDALTAERELLALIAAAVRRDPGLRTDAAAIIRDHTAHLRALQTATAAYDRTGAARTAAPPTLATTSSVRAQLRAAERGAAAIAAMRAAGLTGPAAALLASISACERSHVELLT